MSEVGFVTMGKTSGAEEVKPIGIGMLGYAFMGKAHSNAYKTLAYMTWPPPLMPQLVAIAGRNEDAVSEAARRYGSESYETWQRVAAAGVKHMCAFNYRFVPAVRLARDMIQSGAIGELQHFRGAYLPEWGTTEGDIWRFQKDIAGSGSLGDLGAHVIDLARYLVGEVAAVSALTATFQ